MHWKLSPKWAGRWGSSRVGKERTLQNVEQDIAQGNLGRARGRLHGLVAQYPEDLSLRARLAEVYWSLHYPAMAGRYWYLHEPQDERMRTAIAEFERECGNDPLVILNRIRFRGQPDDLTSPYARDQLRQLQEACLREHRYYPVFPKKGKKQHMTAHWSWSERLWVFGCLAVLTLVLLLAVIGCIAVVGSLVGRG